MTNWEKHANELKDILCNYIGGFAVRKDTEEIVECNGCTSCDECMFNNNGHCPIARRKWLDEEYEESKAPEIDWSKVPVDTPIVVWNADEECKWKKHFAKYKNGRIYTWNAGETSYTGNHMEPWFYAEIAPGIDCSGWYKQGGH